MVLKAVLTKPNKLLPGADRTRHGECVRSLGRSSYTRCSKEDLFMRTNYDFTPLRRSTVGFDRLFDLLENGLTSQVTDNYPPFDLVSEGEDRYRINMAVAGFRPGEIEVTAQQNLLVVSGRKQESEESRYIHRGIAARDFERRFGLADYVQVKNAELKDGMLSIEL